MILENINKTTGIIHQTSNINQFHKYQKLKSMQSFRQKFSDMTREYRDGFRPQMDRAIYNVSSTIKVGEKVQ